MQCMELVPALVTLLPVVLVYLRKTAKLVMVIVSAIQTAIFLMTAVRMSTVLLVIQKHKESIMLYIELPSSFLQNTEPRTCADVGITSCCSDTSGAGLCDVHFQDTQSHCSCNMTCHLRNDCCSDAVEFCVRKLFCCTLSN